MSEEQLLTVELDPVRDTDVGHVPALAGGADRLLHGLLSADALQNRIGAQTLGQLHDAGDAFVAALSDDISGAELASELLPGTVAAHRDDPLGTHLPGGEHAE